MPHLVSRAVAAVKCECANYEIRTGAACPVCSKPTNVRRRDDGRKGARPPKVPPRAWKPTDYQLELEELEKLSIPGAHTQPKQRKKKK